MKRQLQILVLAAALAAACSSPKRADKPLSATAVEPVDTAYGAPATDSLALAAAAFTQGFYDWYRSHNDRMDVAIGQGTRFLGSDLLDALRADLAANAASKDGPVGLDWDPFTASQEMCDPYRVRRTFRRGDTVLVEVTQNTCVQEAPGLAAVVAEVMRAGTGWAFVNFRYPKPAHNLLADLDNLRAEREKH